VFLDEWMGRWMDFKTVLWFAYSNKNFALTMSVAKPNFHNGIRDLKVFLTLNHRSYGGKTTCLL
jgi:hypothetical protein